MATLTTLTQARIGEPSARKIPKKAISTVAANWQQRRATRQNCGRWRFKVVRSMLLIEALINIVSKR